MTPKKKYNPEEWKSQEEAAKILGIKPSTLRDNLSRGKIPRESSYQAFSRKEAIPLANPIEHWVI